MGVEYSLIIDKMKGVAGQKSDAGLARALGISPQNLANFKRRGEIPTDLVLSFAFKYQISLDQFIGDKCRSFVKETPHKHEPKFSDIAEPIRLLTEIFEEGDKEKIAAIVFQLKALRPKS